MEAFWIIQSSFSLFGTKLARKQQENYPIFFMIFLVLSILWTKNARKSVEINFRDSVKLQPILMERRFFWTLLNHPDHCVYGGLKKGNINFQLK